jgi:hypothetical protein
VTLYTRHKFDSRQKAAELFDLFEEAGGTFKPSRFGASEPAKRVYDPKKRSAALKLLSGAPDFEGGGVMLKGSKFKFLAWITWQAAPEAVSTWHMWLDEKFFQKDERVEEFFEFVEKLCARFAILFGGACPEEDWDAKHWVNVKGALAKTGAALDRCLPGVYWLTAFGAPLVEHFGREKFEGLPVRRVLDFGANGLGLVLRESPYEPGKAERLRHDSEVAKLLGADYFFDAAAPEKECRPVPSVTRGGAEPVPTLKATAPAQEFGVEDLKKVTVLDAVGEPVRDLEDLAEMLVVFLHGEVDEASDYSRAALEAVDEHFAKHPQRKEYKPEHLNEEFLPALGAFFGEVLVRNLKAKWVEREPLPRSTVKHGDTEVSPFEVAYRSVYEGAGLAEAFDRLARLPSS